MLCSIAWIHASWYSYEKNFLAPASRLPMYSPFDRVGRLTTGPPDRYLMERQQRRP